MSKTQVSKEEFLNELNRNLKEHPGYEEWMQFVPAPDGIIKDRQPDYSHAGPNPEHSLYELIAMKVGEAFEIFPK
ncbi:hypothetical protein RGU70_12345 [Herbaspirillum sp. RTI4]|uniref:hypothetical protein n=1 Tax=Herbaspirillum sp. RTI4 TaxID=3048640 RepID=UPI002AB48F58|nr:hypothetical protein [Herbaspirillum sp. RTI4]MDY7579111.1 hypothetical protein [Herbaspirillum sp. RTI4]MEA9981310.1 hypothetical protein [Herbaspirillum sp. RTI4]